MNRRLSLFLTMLLLLPLLTGCGAAYIERPTLEDLGMVGVMGFDYVDEERMKVTVSLPQPSTEAQEKTQTYSSVVHLPHEAIMEMSTKSERPLSLNQLRVVLFSEEFARKRGIERVIKLLYRDPVVGDNVFIATVKDSAQELVQGEYPGKPGITTFLNDLLRPKTATAVSTFTTLHSLVYSLTDQISDPVMAYLEKVDSTVEIKRVALFKKGKMIDTISPEDGKLLVALQDQTRLPHYISFIDDPPEEKRTRVMLTFVQNRMSMKSNGDLKHPVLAVKIRLRGNLIDYTGNRDLSDEASLVAISREMSRDIEQRVRAVLERCQELGVDPAGIGEAFRRKHRGRWTKDSWNEALPRVEFKVQVRTLIISTGTLE